MKRDGYISSKDSWISWNFEIRLSFRDILKRANEGAANATINRELSALKRMLNLGLKYGKVGTVPKITLLKEKNVPKGFFEHDEFLAVRDALPDYLKGFITFAYKTGWRVDEIVYF